MSFRLTLPLPPKPLWPNARPDRWKKAKAVREYRQLAWGFARDAVWNRERRRAEPPNWTEAETRVVFYFRDRRVRDRDNAAAALKAAWDGIADAGVVADDAGLVHFPVELRYDPARPRVEIELVPRRPNRTLTPAPLAQTGE